MLELVTGMIISFGAFLVTSMDLMKSLLIKSLQTPLLIIACFIIAFFMRYKTKDDTKLFTMIFYTIHIYFVLITGAYFLTQKGTTLTSPDMFGLKMIEQQFYGISRAFIDCFVISMILSFIIAFLLRVTLSKDFWKTFQLSTIIIYFIALIGTWGLEDKPVIISPFLGENSVLDWAAQYIIGIPALFSLRLIIKGAMPEKQESHLR